MSLLSKLSKLFVSPGAGQQRDPRVLRSVLSWISRRSLQTSEKRKGGGGSHFDNAIWKEEPAMRIRPSKWSDHIIKDFLYFYGAICALPLLAIGSYFAIFVGPATLETIPEDYRPKEEEYERKPITRLFLRYIYPSFQEVYETRLHCVYVEEKRYKRTELMKEIERVMREVGDSKAFYYHPSYAKYLRRGVESDLDIKKSQGVA